ncbi:MAG: nucleotidyl transferase AbiEii/AbiGii toxin family protein [Chloroflexota bacterium]|nr:nucleotidyl transferase AbiEii/AbiGii toxin family protein [Chloroflexota bacterium]
MTETKPIKGLGILTPLQKQFLEIFATLPDQSQFYLAGGTALAEYYFGHRLSYDLDIFTGMDGLVQPTSFQIEKVCAEKNLPIKVVRRFATFVEFLVSDELKVDLALDSPFRFGPTVLSETGVQVNNYVDLSTDKLLAYFGRSEPRDAIDLYFILQKESIEVLMEQAAQKDTGFDAYWFAIALNRCEKFPDELERWPVKMLKQIDPKNLKSSFQKSAVELLDKFKPE